MAIHKTNERYSVYYKTSNRIFYYDPLASDC